MGSKSLILGKALLDYRYGVATYTPNVNVGLLAGELWIATNVYVSGDIVVATNFPTVPKIFKCTTGGTSDSSEPNWAGVAAGGTIADDTVVWTEQSLAIIGGTYTEPDTANWTDYAQAVVVNNNTNFPAATGTSNPAKANGTAIELTAAAVVVAGAVGVVGWITVDDNGDVMDWQALSAFVQVANGAQVQFDVGDITIVEVLP